MRSLIGKDFVAARWFLLVAVPLYAAQLASLGDSPPGAMIVTLIFSGLFAFGSIGVEEAQGTEVTWSSLPIDRSQFVRARYVTTTLGVLIGVGMSWAISGGELGLVAQATAFFVLITAASLFLPCYFRFGAGKGLMVFSILSLTLIALLAGVGALIASLANHPTVGSPQAWFQNAGGFVAIVLVAVALLIAVVSSEIAVRWYHSRDY